MSVHKRDEEKVTSMMYIWWKIKKKYIKKWVENEIEEKVNV